jgi:hypothetical protein
MAVLGIILIALGAILRYGVTVVADGVDLDVVGLVLLAVGVAALLGGLVASGRFTRSRTRERVERGPDGIERVTEHSRGL